MSDEGEKRGGPDTVWVATGQYLGYGLTWAFSTLLFLWGGWELDERVGTVPLFTILGAFLGAGDRANSGRLRELPEKVNAIAGWSESWLGNVEQAESGICDE